MAKIVFFNVPAHGHINPTLPLVAELVQRGNEVIYYAMPEFQDKIQKTGARFRAYDLHRYEQFHPSANSLRRVPARRRYDRRICAAPLTNHSSTY